MEATFYPGTAIRAEDLNDNFDQLRLALQEQRCELYGNVKLLLEDKVWTKYRIGTTISGKVTGDTVAKPDQLQGRWPADGKDEHIATTDAISARLDPYVQDSKPSPYGLPNKEQEGKFWIDDGTLELNYWDDSAQAWVSLAMTGPVGPQGPVGPMGVYQTLIASTPPVIRTDGTAIQPGDVWLNTNTGLLYTWYPDGDSNQWISVTKTGPVGPAGPLGPMGTYKTLVSSVPPSNRADGTPIQAGDVWLDTNNGVLYTWYIDADSSQWISVTRTGPAGSPGPAGPQGIAGPQGPQGLTGPAGPAAAGLITGHSPITVHRTGADFDLTFDPIPLTTLP